MRTVGVTGHVLLTAATTALVREALRAAVDDEATQTDRLVGVSCLAPGTDTLFAEAVLAAGGELVAVLPSADYRRHAAAAGPSAADRYDRLVNAASEVVLMPFGSAGQAAYEAASQEMLKRSDELFAVWDGLETGPGGGTAHTVATARDIGVPVQVIWPATAARVD